MATTSIDGDQRQQRSRQTRTLNAQTESAVILFVDSNDFKKAIQSIFYNLLVVSRFLTISHAFLEKKNTNLTIFNQARLACLRTKLLAASDA